MEIASEFLIFTGERACTGAVAKNSVRCLCFASARNLLQCVSKMSMGIKGAGHGSKSEMHVLFISMKVAFWHVFTRNYHVV